MVWILSLAAFVGATLSAVAGLGGGTLLIGVMFAVGLAPVVAVPLHAAVQAVSNASRALAYRHDIHWPSAAWFTLSCLPLPFVTAPLIARADADAIRLILALAIVLSLMPGVSAALHTQWPLRRKMLVAGALNGAVGMVIGATGLIIGPFFLDRDWSKETTVGTLALCQSVGHVLKIAAFGVLGFGLLEQWTLAVPLMLAVALGTLFGRRLMRLVSRGQFAFLFKTVLVLLALRLAVTGSLGLLERL